MAVKGRITNRILIFLIVVVTVSQVTLISLSTESTIINNNNFLQSPIEWIQQGFSLGSKLNRKPDGTFNGYPIYYRDENHEPIHSSVQCVGENYRKKAWIHRSCKFRHLCFDTKVREFIIYQSEEERVLENAMVSEFMGFSNRMNTTVSIGGVNTKWTWNIGIPRVEWFPKIVQGELRESYYELDPDVVWVPFHSLLAKNPGHLIWDDFLPIYNLLRIFNLLENHQPLLLRYILEGKGMWATCDMNEVNRKGCDKMYSKFLPLMGLHEDNFTATDNIQFKTNNNTAHTSNLVCAAQGAAGLGMLTDHGMKLHGWNRKDYETMHNHGRGPMLYEFRNFMALNVGVPILKVKSEPPYIVTFSERSSQAMERNIRYFSYKQALAEEFGDKLILRSVDLSTKSVEEQIRLASESAIFVSACGGGAVTAHFLPEGASLILFYNQNGGIEDNRHTGLPARLDWDIFNNMGYIRTHWLPIGNMYTKPYIDTFVKLVGHEIDVLNDQILN